MWIDMYNMYMLKHKLLNYTVKFELVFININGAVLTSVIICVSHGEIRIWLLFLANSPQTRRQMSKW